MGALVGRRCAPVTQAEASLSAGCRTPHGMKRPLSPKSILRCLQVIIVSLRIRDMSGLEP
jgi:hypothetical protein